MHRNLDLEKDDLIQDTMIRASRKQNMKMDLLLKTHRENGLVGVYNLGMEHMYKYLMKKHIELSNIKLYIDLDNVVFNTTKCIVDLYDEDFCYYSDYKKIPWENIRSWNFNELSAAKTEQINSYFNQSRFFNNVEFIDDAYSIIAKLAISYDIYFVSHGYSPNLRLKEKFIKQKFPFAKFIGVNLKEYKDKSCVDMSGGIFIDDAINNLEGSNADFKICFGNYSWNEEWDGIRCESWNKVNMVIDSLVGR